MKIISKIKMMMRKIMKMKSFKMIKMKKNKINSNNNCTNTNSQPIKIFSKPIIKAENCLQIRNYQIT